MEETHRRVLRNKRMYLLDNLSISDRLLSSMLSSDTQSGILTSNVYEEVMNKSTRHSKISCLLDFLPRRGPLAFERFIKALVEDDQTHIADQLDSFLSGRFKTNEKQNFSTQKPVYAPHIAFVSEKELLLQLEEDNEPIMEFNVKSVSAHDEYMKSQFNNLRDVYPMDSKPRARVVFINNEKFAHKLPPRDGSSFDLLNLDNLFTQFNYDTSNSLYSNCTRFELIDAIEKESRHPALRDVNLFIMVIMSHGSRGQIFCHDFEPVKIDDIVSRFDGTNCPSLSGKPKMFIIQACQGENYTRGVVVADDISPDSVKVDNPAIPAGINQFDTSDTTPVLPTTHEKADILLAYSTVPDYKSWRNTENGSWFIRTLIRVFASYSHVEHVSDMLTKVAQIMDERRTIEKKFRQITRTDSTLKKKLYLFPGL